MSSVPIECGLGGPSTRPVPQKSGPEISHQHEAGKAKVDVARTASSSQTLTNKGDDTSSISSTESAMSFPRRGNPLLSDAEEQSQSSKDSGYNKWSLLACNMCLLLCLLLNQTEVIDYLYLKLLSAAFNYRYLHFRQFLSSVNNGIKDDLFVQLLHWFLDSISDSGSNVL